jgi:ankyrin repeat protein
MSLKNAPPEAERPVIEHILIYVAYAGYAAEVDALLYGVCNRAIWEDEELHAAVLMVHHGPQLRTRLHAAARAGDVPRLTRLLRSPSGALRALTNVNGVTVNCGTALAWAAGDGHAGAVQALLAAGAAIEAATVDGGTPLHRAPEEGHTDVVVALLSAGAAVGAVDGDGQTPLQLAAREGHTGVV